MPEPDHLLSDTPLAAHLQRLVEQLAAARTRSQVLQVTLQTALEASGAIRGAALLLDEEKQHLTRLEWWPAGVEITGDSALVERHLTSRALAERKPLFFEQAAQVTRAFPELHTPFASATLPLLFRDVPLGAVVLKYPDGHEFGEAQQQFLQTLSAQCAVALSRQYERTQRHQHEQRFRRLVEESPVGIAAGDLSGQLILVNDAYLSMFNFTRTQFEAGDMDWLRLTPPEYQPGDEAAFARAFAEGRSGHYEKEMLSRDGERIPVSVNLIRYDEAGSPFVVGYVQDLRPFRAAEETLREYSSTLEKQVRERTARLERQRTELEARTRALEGFSELTRDIDFQSDPYALIERAQQLMLSLTPHGYADYFELAGGRWWSKVRTGERRNPQLQASVDAGLPDEPLVNLRQPFETLKPYYQSQYDPQADGLEAHVQQLGSTATLPVCLNGRAHGILTLGLFDPHHWSSTDRAVLETVVRALELALEGAQGVMALRQRTLELERSNQELEQFAYVASHDLQEPLRTVTSFTQLLLKRLDVSDPRAQRYAQFITEGTGRMSRLIQDLLEFSRVATQGREPQRVNTQHVLEQVVHDLQVQIEQAGAHVQVSQLPDTEADGTQVRQLFQNLIGNALKFSAPQRSPTVQVTARRDRPMIEFQVQDNGIGIAPEHYERIFTIFQRLHQRQEYEGSGIGLSIARRIVERHGGNIWLESTPGAGTTFHFTLPAAH